MFIEILSEDISVCKLPLQFWAYDTGNEKEITAYPIGTYDIDFSKEYKVIISYTQKPVLHIYPKCKITYIPSYNQIKINVLEEKVEQLQSTDV